jgi:hypothetical protein
MTEHTDKVLETLRQLCSFDPRSLFDEYNSLLPVLL